MVKETNKQAFWDRFLKTAFLFLIILLASVVQVYATKPFSFIVLGDTHLKKGRVLLTGIILGQLFGFKFCKKLFSGFLCYALIPLFLGFTATK